MKNFVKFRQFFSNIMLFIGWLLLLIVTIYLILKVFGVVKSASFEEVILALLLPQYILLGTLQERTFDLTNRVEKIENKLEKNF
jgi:uncharacterized membrane protein